METLIQLLKSTYATTTSIVVPWAPKIAIAAIVIVLVITGDEDEPESP